MHKSFVLSRSILSQGLLHLILILMPVSNSTALQSLYSIMLKRIFLEREEKRLSWKRTANKYCIENFAVFNLL